MSQNWVKITNESHPRRETREYLDIIKTKQEPLVPCIDLEQLDAKIENFFDLTDDENFIVCERSDFHALRIGSDKRMNDFVRPLESIFGTIKRSHQPVQYH